MGELLSLFVALIWAFAVILFKKSGESVHPIALNMFKNAVAIVLFIPTMYILEGGVPQNVPTSDYVLLLISGAIGIAIADTLFFSTLNILGAGLTAIVDCLYVPFVVACSMLMLGDTLNLWQGIGISLIVAGIFVSSYLGSGKAATPEAQAKRLPPKRLALGITYGVLAMFGMAYGIVLVKPQVEGYPVVWVSEVRMIGGFLMLCLMLALHPKRRAVIGSLGKGPGQKFAVGGALVGGYLAMMLWIAGMKFADASIAAALNQNSNLIIFILAYFFLKEPLTLPKAVGIVSGIAGVITILMAG